MYLHNSNRLWDDEDTSDDLAGSAGFTDLVGLLDRMSLDEEDAYDDDRASITAVSSFSLSESTDDDSSTDTFSDEDDEGYASGDDFIDEDGQHIAIAFLFHCEVDNNLEPLVLDYWDLQSLIREAVPTLHNKFPQYRQLVEVLFGMSRQFLGVSIFRMDLVTYTGMMPGFVGTYLHEARARLNVEENGIDGVERELRHAVKLHSELVEYGLLWARIWPVDAATVSMYGHIEGAFLVETAALCLELASTIQREVTEVDAFIDDLLSRHEEDEKRNLSNQMQHAQLDHLIPSFSHTIVSPHLDAPVSQLTSPTTQSTQQVHIHSPGVNRNGQRTRPFDLVTLINTHLNTLSNDYGVFDLFLKNRLPKSQPLDKYERLCRKLRDYRELVAELSEEYMTSYKMKYEAPHTEAESETMDIGLVTFKDELKEWQFRLNEFINWLNDENVPSRRAGKNLWDRMHGIDPTERVKRRGAERRNEARYESQVAHELAELKRVLEYLGNRAETMVKVVDAWYRDAGKTFIYKKDGWYLGPEAWENATELEDAEDSEIDAMISVPG
ncbi:hypothetical protein BJ508DRAFT_373789 [Ascobolus immersus RN42]|uniref:Uncharacterized protein n=1 Tax=Ascobolus immersus RN42 TaxID=1160509 RepID=A0A3N4IGV5_ASCIM|nr:hypothetical protein BJ508DRAFT_373789 [Ascobolus immersus RN42]